MSKYKVGDLVLFPDPHSQVKHLSIVLGVSPSGELRLHTFGTSHYLVDPNAVSSLNEPEPPPVKARKAE